MLFHEKSIIVLIAFFVSGCGTRIYELNPQPIHTENHLEDFYGHADTEVSSKFVVNKNGTFLKLASEASTKPTKSGPARIYLDAGVTLSDLYCDRFFNKLAAKKATTDAARGEFNILDGLSSAILGLSGAGATSIAITSTSFAALDASFENLDASFLVAPQIEQVKKLVFLARDTLREEILKTSPAENYFEAERSLRAYAALCQFEEIKRLVNDAVGKGRTELIHSTTARDGLFSQVSEELIDALSLAIANENTRLSDDNLIALYALNYLGHSPDVKTKILQALKKVIKADENGIVATILENKKSDIRTYLAKISPTKNLASHAKIWVNSIEEALAEALKKKQDEDEIVGTLKDVKLEIVDVEAVKIPQQVFSSTRSLSVGIK